MTNNSEKNSAEKEETRPLDQLLSKVLEDKEEADSGDRGIDENNEYEKKLQKLTKENKKLKENIAILERKLGENEFESRDVVHLKEFKPLRTKKIIHYAWLYLIPLTVLLFSAILYYNAFYYRLYAENFFVLMISLVVAVFLASYSYSTYIRREKSRESDFEDYFGKQQAKSKTVDYIGKGGKHSRPHHAMVELDKI